MKRILLSQGKVALVDDVDYEELSQYKWYYSQGYARRSNNGRKILMHRQIMETPVGMVTDHINMNKLDNRRGNLRVVTPSQNNVNSVARTKNKSGFKGVTWYEPTKRWSVGISVGRKRIYIGYFKDKNQAAKAYNNAARKYYGEFARLNEVS